MKSQAMKAGSARLVSPPRLRSSPAVAVASYAVVTALEGGMISVAVECLVTLQATRQTVHLEGREEVILLLEDRI